MCIGPVQLVLYPLFEICMKNQSDNAEMTICKGIQAQSRLLEKEIVLICVYIN